MGKHRGIYIGILIILIGGIFGYFLGKQSPAIVTSSVQVGATLAPFVLGLAIAGLATLFWGVGEILAVAFGVVERRVVVVRLGIALIASLVGVITNALQLLGVVIIHPDPHSLFAYQPLATGLAAAALGAHALIHQIHLNRAFRN